jgi:hypothetical protein
MRNQQFPVRASEVLDAIALHDLYDEVENVIAGRKSPRPLEELARQLDDFRARFTFLYSATYGDPPTLQKDAT